MNNRIKLKKSSRFALLFYALFMGISGTIMFTVPLLWVIPKEKLSIVSLPLTIMALFLYGTCGAALLISYKFFKRPNYSPFSQISWLLSVSRNQDTRLVLLLHFSENRCIYG